MADGNGNTWPGVLGRLEAAGREMDSLPRDDLSGVAEAIRMRADALAALGRLDRESATADHLTWLRQIRDAGAASKNRLLLQRASLRAELAQLHHQASHLKALAAGSGSAAGRIDVSG